MGATFVVGQSRNPMLNRAWADFKAESKAGDKAAPVARLKDNPLRSEPYRRLVASMPCKFCHVQGHSQAAHPPTEGKAIKQDDRECFPLCSTRAGPKGGIEGCHPKFDQYKLMPHDKAVKQAGKWAAETRAEVITADAWPKKLERYPEPKKAQARGKKS